MSILIENRTANPSAQHIYLRENHILVQNTPEILDPEQKYGAKGEMARLILHVLARSGHMALSGDTVIVNQNTPPDFLKYLETVTGEHPKYSFAKVQEPLFTRDLLKGLDASTHKDHVLNPYLQGQTLASFSEQTGIQLAFTSKERIMEGAVEKANDKIHFREMAHKLSIPVAPDQINLDINRRRDIFDNIDRYVDKHLGAFLQVPKSGAGIGNINIQETDNGLQSKLGIGREQIYNNLSIWLQEMQKVGNNRLIIAPYIDILSTHTVNGFIPPDGEPWIFGVNKQIVEEGSNNYMGFEFPAVDPEAQKYSQEMILATERWLKYLQQDLGYIGPSDVDFFVGSLRTRVGGITKNEVAMGASESNTRWDAMRFGLHHLARLNGWRLRDLHGIDSNNTPSIRAIDHVPTRAATTTEILTLLRGHVPLLGIDGDSEGVVVMVPPSQKIGGTFETGLAAIGDNINVARTMYSKAEAAIKPR